MRHRGWLMTTEDNNGRQQRMDTTTDDDNGQTMTDDDVEAPAATAGARDRRVSSPRYSMFFSHLFYFILLTFIYN